MKNETEVKELSHWTIKDVSFDGEHFEINMVIVGLGTTPAPILARINMNKCQIEEMRRVIKLYEEIYPYVLSEGK